MAENDEDSWSQNLSQTEVPFQSEKEKKHENATKAAPNTQEQITALRQNLSHPGKIITVRASEGSLPYEGVEEILVIADSSNNRYVVLNAETNETIEVIGTGKIGSKDGSFNEAEFYHTQGLCHYVNDKKQHCLLLCDVKNHLIREANLTTK